MLDNITIYNDEGEESVFYVMEQTQINGNSYLLATESDDDEELEAWIFKQVRTEEDDIVYTTIEDEEEIKAVMKVFEALLDDYDIEM